MVTKPNNGLSYQEDILIGPGIPKFCGDKMVSEHKERLRYLIPVLLILCSTETYVYVFDM